MAELFDNFGVKVLTAVYGAVQKVMAELQQPSAEHPPQHLWKKREAVLTALTLNGAL